MRTTLKLDDNDGNDRIPASGNTPPSPTDATRTRQRTHDASSGPASGVPGGRVGDPSRYRIIGEHGRGGLGRVSRAHDRELGRDIAIKELISRGHLGEVRFLREALITARLEHPGIVPVYEAGRWPDGTPFYAMKLVAGRPLRDLIAERTTVDERIGLLHHVIAVADAIAYAHRCNIIHRDLKPSNVIVGEFGETVVIDWGLAKDLSAAEHSVAGSRPRHDDQDDGLTSAGTILGTPAYMAPEQARGEAVDRRADVFAIGVMLWELCSLEKLPPNYTGQRRRILHRARVANDLAAIIDKALDPHPERRYPDASALAADLRAFKAGARVSARHYSLWAVLARWRRRIAVVAGIVASATVIGLMQLHTRYQASTAEQVAAATALQAEVEQGRQALLHGESGDAVRHLERAYQRDGRSPAVRFMLARALQPRMTEVARLVGSSGRVWTSMFTPDGKRILTTDDTSARMWDAGSGHLLFTMDHGDTVYQAAFSPDGATIVTAGGDGTVRIWSAATGAPIRQLSSSSRTEGLRYYAVGVMSHFVAAMDTRGSVARVWDADTGVQVAELANDPAGAAWLVVSADGRWLATSGGDDVRVFDTSTWQRVATIVGPRTRSIGFDPSSAHLVVGTYDGSAAIWEVPSGRRLHLLRAAGESVDAVAFSLDGTVVATGSRDGTEQVWDVASGRLRTEFNAHHSKLYAIEFSPTGDVLLSASADGSVTVSNVVTGMRVTRLEGPTGLIFSAHFAPRGERVVGASWDGTARVWEPTSPYRRWASLPIGPECDTADSLVPDPRFIAVSCRNHGTRVWDTARGQLLAELPEVTTVAAGYYSALPAVTAAGDRAAIARGNKVEMYALPSGELLGAIVHTAPVNAVAFAASGHHLVSGAIDGSLMITRDNRGPVALPRSAAGIDAVSILADGRVVVADAHRRLRLIDPLRLETTMDVAAPSRTRTLRSSADGQWLITVPTTNEPVSPALWDTARGRLVSRLDGHMGYAFTARFVAADRQILTAGNDGTTRLWDTATGRLLRTFRGDSHFLSDSTLTPDGSLVVGGGSDGLVRFWDVSDGRLLWTMPAHKTYVVGVHYEGRELVTQGFAGDLARWSLPSSSDVIDACHATACARETSQPE